VQEIDAAAGLPRVTVSPRRVTRSAAERGQASTREAKFCGLWGTDAARYGARSDHAAVDNNG
jgi:hypothetical protein